MNEENGFNMHKNAASMA